MTGAVSDPDVEEGLSYAFLHAVAARAQAECVVAPRLSDNRGIDVRLTSWGPFPPNAKQEVDLKVQLKATIATPSDSGTHLSYSLKKVSQYDDLRAAAYTVPRILVVLFLPRDPTSWLEVTEDSLALKKSAYWVSLAGAPMASTSSVTIYLPKANLLTPDSLRALFSDIALGRPPTYSDSGGMQ